MVHELYPNEDVTIKKSSERLHLEKVQHQVLEGSMRLRTGVKPRKQSHVDTETESEMRS